MRVTFRGKDGFEFTDALANYIEAKLTRVANYFRHPEDLKVRVVGSVYDAEQIIEVTIPTKKLLLRAEESAKDMYAAVDLVVDKLERQIQKHKDKINSLYRRSEGLSNLFKSNEELDIEGLNAEIVGINLVKNKKVELIPMTVEEAAIQMEMIDHDFFIFLNKETNKVNILYRRKKDHELAIIETEYEEG